MNTQADVTLAYDLDWRGNAPRLPGPLTLAREGGDGAAWYRDALATLDSYATAHGFDVATVADVVALTSPRQSVARNVQLAHAYLTTGSTSGTLPSVRAALAHWEVTRKIRGDKTRAFSAALQGDVDAVVLDVWMFRAFGLGYKTLTSKRYREVSARVRGIATRASMTPRDAQAAIWTATRARYGFSAAPLPRPS